MIMLSIESPVPTPGVKFSTSTASSAFPPAIGGVASASVTVRSQMLEPGAVSTQVIAGAEGADPATSRA